MRSEPGRHPLRHQDARRQRPRPAPRVRDEKSADAGHHDHGSHVHRGRRRGDETRRRGLHPETLQQRRARPRRAPALGEKQLQDENLYLRQELAGKYTFANIIGRGSRMQEIFRTIERIGKVSSTVLLTGESGTGKELIARAIHFSSIRKDRKFVSINCGALPETLLESELFGHERGAFTGAVREKRGLFQEADGGTLFLDEISETTPDDAGQASAGDPGKGHSQGRRQRRDLRRRAHHRRDEPRPDGPRRGGPVPRGPLLPDQRHPDRAAAAAVPRARTSRR